MKRALSRSTVYSEQVTWLFVAFIAAMACGLAVSKQSLGIAVTIPVVMLATSFASFVNAGAFVGVALVMANNALVGINLANVSLSGAVNGTDLAFGALFVLALSRYLLYPESRPERPVAWLLTIWSLAFLGLWCVELIRALDVGTPYLQTLSIGRDFLYFGLTLPFACSLIRTDAELRQFCIAVGALLTLYAGADLAATLGIAPATIANALLTKSQGSLTRVYNTDYYLFELAFGASAAYALLNKGRRAHVATFIAIVSAIALTISLTRALYIGVIIALFVTLILWSLGPGPTHRLLRRRLVATAVVSMALGGVLLLAVPERLASGPIDAIAARATSATSALASSSAATSTVAYRQRVDSLMLQQLGTHWPVGLGFLSPQTTYFADLPTGTIRNNDVGLFNSLMTMGIVGSVLLYLPPLWLLCVLLRRAWSRVGRDSHLWMGGTIWLLTALITTYSLGSLASVSGLATVAVGTGVLLAQLKRPSGGASSQVQSISEYR